MTPPNRQANPTLAPLIDALAEHGHAVVDGLLASDLLDALRARARSLPDSAFTAAGVGRRTGHGLQPDFRSDRIHWLEPSDAAESAWLAWAENLRQQVNRELFMGLQSFEAHFAHYAPGQRYGRHRDAFVGQANRVLSTVLYLNADWSVDDGGELLMDTGDAANPTRVLPLLGRLVVFLSEHVAHEVLPARRDRYSIAGWFRVRTDAF